MLWVYAVAGLAMFVCLPFYMYYKKALRWRVALSYKVLGTLCAASFALIAAIRLDEHCWICFAALMLHAAADAFLEYNLYLGAGFFLAGHVCYISFFLHLFPVSVTHLAIALCLLALVAVLFRRWRETIGKRMPLFAVYAGVLSVMCAFAIAGLTGHTLQGQLIAAGGALFYFSDALLLGRLLFSADRSVDWVIMITYYAAQLLFGVSCLL